jgi:hypothetical protein
VPPTLQAALVFALLVSPGFVLVQGYRRGRTHTLPDRDLYVLAQAVVASLGWLAVVWLLQSRVGDPISSWGLVPQNDVLLEQHREALALLLLAIEFMPFGFGLMAGFVINALQRLDRARFLLGWTGIFEPPTAWEQAWNAAHFRASTSSAQQPIDVSVRLKAGGVVVGRYGSASRADLSPRLSHQLFLETAYGLDDSGSPVTSLGDGTIGGVFIDASEISAVLSLRALSCPSTYDRLPSLLRQACRPIARIRRRRCRTLRAPPARR